MSDWRRHHPFWFALGFAVCVKTSAGQNEPSESNAPPSKTSEVVPESPSLVRKTPGSGSVSFGTWQTIVGISSSMDEKYIWLAHGFNFSKRKESAFMQIMARRNRGGLKTLLPDEWRSLLADVERDFGSKVSTAVVRLEKTDVFQPIIDELALASLRAKKPLDAQEALRLLDEMFDRTVRASGELDPTVLNAESLSKSTAAVLYLTKEQNEALVIAVGHWKASLAQK